MPLNGTYCNALLRAHWPVRQKLIHVSSVQLRRSVRAFNAGQDKINTDRNSELNN